MPFSFLPDTSYQYWPWLLGHGHENANVSINKISLYHKSENCPRMYENTL